MLALAGITSIHISQICDFLAKAGEVFRDISHLLDHTLYLRGAVFRGVTNGHADCAIRTSGSARHFASYQVVASASLGGEAISYVTLDAEVLKSVLIGAGEK